MRVVVGLHNTSGNADKVYFVSFVTTGGSIATVTTAFGRRIAHTFTHNEPTTAPTSAAWSLFVNTIVQKRARDYNLTAAIVDEHPVAPADEALRMIAQRMRAIADPVWLRYSYSEVLAWQHRRGAQSADVQPTPDSAAPGTSEPAARQRRSRTLQLAEITETSVLDVDLLTQHCAVQVGIDGVRYLAVKTDGELVVRAHSGRALTRYPQAIRAALTEINDIGLELVIEESETLTAVDLVRLDGRLLSTEPFRIRYAALAKQKTRRRIPSIGVARAYTGDLTIATLHTAAAKGASHLTVHDLRAAYGQQRRFCWATTHELEAEVRDVDATRRIVGVVAQAGARGAVALALAVPRDAALPNIGARVRVTCSDLATMAGARYAGMLAA